MDAGRLEPGGVVTLGDGLVGCWRRTRSTCGQRSPVETQGARKGGALARHVPAGRRLCLFSRPRGKRLCKNLQWTGVIAASAHTRHSFYETVCRSGEQHAAEEGLCATGGWPRCLSKPLTNVKLLVDTPEPSEVVVVVGALENVEDMASSSEFQACT